MFLPLAFVHLLPLCAPSIGPKTMSALIASESGWQPNAIGDNTARHAFFPASRVAAEALARRLIDAGHNIDVGYTQINITNFGSYRLSLHDAFDPCINLSVGASILSRNYAASILRYGRGRSALLHALSAYHSGGFENGLVYAKDVLRRATR
jgi:type IV secretion system protein VirB1